CSRLSRCLEPRDLRSCPTRRSSDLSPAASTVCGPVKRASAQYGVILGDAATRASIPARLFPTTSSLRATTAGRSIWTSPAWTPRSEEHTSELQSRENLVCRLLLEKK